MAILQGATCQMSGLLRKRLQDGTNRCVLLRGTDAEGRRPIFWQLRRFDTHARRRLLSYSVVVKRRRRRIRPAKTTPMAAKPNALGSGTSVAPKPFASA